MVLINNFYKEKTENPQKISLLFDLNEIAFSKVSKSSVVFVHKYTLLLVCFEAFMTNI